MTQKIRVITSFGGWFDMDAPPSFHLPTYVQSIRAAGYALNDTIYVPHEHVISIFVFDPDADPKMPTPAGPPMPPHGSVLQ